MGKLRVLIVEDEMIISWSLEIALQGLGCEVVSIVVSADAAVESARREVLDLILMDIVLKGAKSGVDAALEIRSFSRVPIVFLTGNADIRNDPSILATRAQGIFTKPPSENQLREIVGIACRVRSESAPEA